MKKKIKILFVFLITLFLFFSLQEARAKQKELSGKKDNCTIFVKQTDKSQFQKINCTEKNKYPIPNFGHDKDHCVILKQAFTYFGTKKRKIFKNKNGLYCAMDGYSGNASWWYVK